jgi:hypothetical protein
MNTQPKALRLADIVGGDCAIELRRLHSVNAELMQALNRIASIELQMNGGDWDEITEAQAIAEAVIAKAQE